MTFSLADTLTPPHESGGGKLTPAMTPLRYTSKLLALSLAALGNRVHICCVRSISSSRLLPSAATLIA